MSRILGAKTIAKHLTRATFRGGTARLRLASPVSYPGLYAHPRIPAFHARNYAQPPGGGGGFPGFSLAPQHQKGEALKEYVCHHSIHNIYTI